LCDILKTVLPTILGGFIAGIVGVSIARWQRNRDARNEFLIEISVVRGSIPKEQSYWNFYVNSLDVIRKAVFRALPFLNKSKTSEIISVWRSYQEITQDNLDDHNEIDAYRMAVAGDNKPVPEKPSDVLKSYYTRMSEIVK
jgi:hypothetical protein